MEAVNCAVGTDFEASNFSSEKASDPCQQGGGTFFRPENCLVASIILRCSGARCSVLNSGMSTT